MKKLIIALTMLGLILVGCGEKQGASNASGSNKDPQEKKIVTPSSEDLLEQQIKARGKDDVELKGSMLEVGQKAKDPHYTTELIAIKELDQEADLMGLKIKMVNAKVFEISELSDRAKDDFSYIDSAIGDITKYMAIRYTAENTSDEDLSWAGLTDMVVNDSHQIDVYQNKINSFEPTDIFKGVTQNYNDAVLIPIDEDIKNVRLIFGKMWNDSGLPYEFEVTIKF